MCDIVTNEKMIVNGEFRRMQKKVAIPHFMVVFHVLSEWGNPWKTSVRITSPCTKNWTWDLLHMKHALIIQMKHLMDFLVPFTVSLKVMCEFSIMRTGKVPCDFDVLYQHYDIKTILNPENACCHSVQNPFSFLWPCCVWELFKMTPSPAHYNSSSFYRIQTRA
jgi:hypothetical protein